LPVSSSLAIRKAVPDCAGFRGSGRQRRHGPDPAMPAGHRKPSASATTSESAHSPYSSPPFPLQRESAPIIRSLPTLALPKRDLRGSQGGGRPLSAHHDSGVEPFHQLSRGPVVDCP